MPSSTPCKQLYNNENVGTPARVLSTPRDPFRTPLQPQQPTLFTPSTPLIRTDSLLDGFTPVDQKRPHEQAQVKERDAELEKLQKTSQLNEALQGIRGAGFKTLHSFLDALMNTDNPMRSSQVSQMIDHHGLSLLEGVRRQRPEVANDWALSTTRELVLKESDELAQCFCPQGTSITEILQQFSLKGFLLEAASVASPSTQILATTLCILGKSRNDHATDFQTTMCFYLLACGTSCSLFDVLNHTGITLSYTQATQKIARTQAFMIIWDNLNITFRVSEQRHDSKDHFDNGTTATLVPLYGVEYGGLPLSLKPYRTTRVPVLDFSAVNLFPTRDKAAHVQAGQLWHIQDILYDAYPDLRKRLSASISPCPTVEPIPVHKTEQYPLPAMHIDESSLEGTLSVLSTIFQTSLKLTEDDIKGNGLVICAGDQLTLSLLTRYCSGLRCNDTDFMDNVSRYTEGQDGLFHYWGKPNAKSPWSLWKVNTLLGRRAFSAGWKAKSAPPFRPSYELLLTFALPANILDAFRIYCPKDDLKEWVDSVQSIDEIASVAQWILNELCSGRRVEKLRQQSPLKRDVPFENICLFKRNCLYLRQLKYAIKRGDIGAILDIIKHVMLAFRGTGKTLKYADALFSLTVRLKRMDPKVQKAWLMNWLANLSNEPDGFKEMDLLQEHFNFWAKIIYNAKGSNRRWSWLAMVSTVQKEYMTPFNSKSHTSPSTATDIQTLRENNSNSLEARDLIQAGAAYANKPTAFQNFKHVKYNLKNLGIPGCATETNSEEDEADGGLDGVTEDNDIDFGSDLRTELDDLLLDDDEYPLQSDLGDYVATVENVLDEFDRYG
ncbi:hypothetical protein BYT27DRAFT_7225347 [Phlegmacium glaucopus]|nr:hypothetical protein BYT27DRAFT_7225347 [Phlegmacium glaucopus]